MRKFFSIRWSILGAAVLSVASLFPNASAGAIDRNAR
jgi:hypothetical protein